MKNYFKLKETKKKIYIDITYRNNRKIKGYILDISETGIGIASPVSIRKNTLIYLTPRLRGFVNLSGKVMHVVRVERKSYNYKIGVKFTSLNILQKSSLNEFISRVNKRKFFRLQFV